jgi:hypothetical protein
LQDHRRENREYFAQNFQIELQNKQRDTYIV